MSKKLTPFEEKVRQSLEHYELPYDGNSWNELSDRLDKKVASHTWIVALVAACFFTGIGALSIYHFTFIPIKANSGHHLARFQSQLEAKGIISSDIENEELSIEEGLKSPKVSSDITKKIVSVNPVDSPLTDASADFAPSSENIKNPIEETPASNALSVRPNISKSCAGGEIEFSAMNGPREGSYLWNFGDGNFSNKPNPKHKYGKPGVYDVSLSVTNKKDGQINTTVMNDLITIHPSPNADFEYEFINSANDEPTVKIVNTSENATTYNWKFNDGSTSNAISPIKSYTEKGKKAVILEVANEWGCKDESIKYIHINEEYNLMAPDKFNPRKETFMPAALKGGKVNFKLTVYNGNQPIFETTNKNKGWDGKLPGGIIADQGSFPWIVIIYNETTHEEKYFSGTVSILP